VTSGRTGGKRSSLSAARGVSHTNDYQLSTDGLLFMYY